MKEENFILIPESFAIKEPNKGLLKLINEKEFNDKILYQKESAFHDISVVENEIGRFLHFTNTYQAGFIDTNFYKGNLPYINYFLIPYLIKKNVKKILLIGLGTGKILNDLAFLYKGLEKIDAVDIEENILTIAKDYFNFKEPENFNFHLQDGRIFLRENKEKYDLIIVDVANNDGIDARFLEKEYLSDIKNSLNEDGIFVSNLCSSAEFEHPDNKFLTSTLKLYNKYFKNNLVFKGDYSDEVYYKSFFDINTRVIDVTNVIIISSDKYTNDDIKTPITIENSEEFKKLKININNYTKDLYKFKNKKI